MADDDMTGPDCPQSEESIVTLNQPGKLIPVLERCMASRLQPHRSGWSEAHHLGRDLRRHFGVAAPGSAVEAACMCSAAVAAWT